MLGTAINRKCSFVVFVYLFSCEDENMNSLQTRRLHICPLFLPSAMLWEIAGLV